MSKEVIAIIVVLVVIIIYLISDIISYKKVLKRCRGLLENFTWKAEKDIEKVLKIENLSIGGIYIGIAGVKVKIVDAVVNDQGTLYILYRFVNLEFKGDNNDDKDFFLGCSCERFKSIFNKKCWQLG